jgi:signal transduction histidine kinase/CheY-like chemotaxis protein
MFLRVRKKIRRMKIATRLTLSFMLIIALLLTIALQTNLTMRQANSRHEDNIYYILGRRELVYRIQAEFNNFRFRLRNSFLDFEWRREAGRHERRDNARHLGDYHASLLALADAHILLATNDPIISDERRELVIYAMGETRDYFCRIYYQFFNHFFPGSDHTENMGNVPEYMLRVDELLNFLIDVVAISVDDTLRETDALIYRSMNFTIMLVVVSFIFAAALAYSMTASFNERIHGIEKNIKKLQEGDIEGVSLGKSNDEITRIAGGIIDVFKDREHESKQRMQSMFDATPLYIEFWNNDIECIDCNQATLKFHGASSKEDFLANYTKIVFEPNSTGALPWDGLKSHIKLAFVQGESRYEYENFDDNNKSRFYSSYAQRIYIDSEPIVVTYVQDVTTQNEVENERRRTAVAVENSMAKSRFLARMSHEIRTPLTAVLGISEIQLQNPTIPLVVEEAFAKIYNSSNILLNLVNDILDLSRIESGKLNVVNKPYEVASMVIDVVQMHLIYLGSKKIEFRVNTDKDLPAFLLGDELRVRQILNNLLSNAFKYTESGMVELTLKRLEHTDSDNITLQVQIRDTGHGMKPEHLKFLTEEYTRFHENELRLVDGTGLGMPIVYNLIQLMGGDINIESEVGFGTNIVITLPQGIEGDAIIGEETAANLMSIDNLSGSLVKRVKFVPEPMPYGKVLVVDDIDTNLYVARGLLMFYDLQIETCMGGREAIDLVKKGNTYDIIFMDQMMPELNGTEATRILRSMGYKLPVIALTANALIGQAELFLANGFDGFLSKPIQTVHLNGILNKYIRDIQPPEVIEGAIKAAVNADGLNNYMDSEMAKLRKDFYNGQKHTAKNIRDAVSAGDFETAERLAHTLKGLAGMIKEHQLEKISSKTEKTLKQKTLHEEDIILLENQLSIILSDIEGVLKRDVSASVMAAISDDERSALFNKLEIMLAESDATCLSLAEKLVKIPETKVLAKQIENCSFEDALITLRTMRAVLEI